MQQRRQQLDTLDQDLAQAYLDRAREDAAALREEGFLMAGSLFPEVVLLKGEPGPAEEAGGQLLSGPDGTALQAALDRLGYPADAWAALSAFVARGSRAARGAGGAEGAGQWASAAPAELAFAMEALDPELAIALDEAAARALQEAWGLERPLAPGEIARVRGRRVLSLGGFEKALADMPGKRTMWARLKLVGPLQPPM